MSKLLLFFFIALSISGRAQEQVLPLDHNTARNNNVARPSGSTLFKTTALTLPFFEDFTDYNVFPNPERWEDHDVYVNNTMGSGIISRGVATFDALNEKSGPYDSTNFSTLLLADSLTSQPIDLTAQTPGDSIYLSFFYQPQGLGFAPEKQDSLMLFLKRINGSWDKVWADTGALVKPFVQVMIPVRDTFYFGSDFQFRFINKASINLNDDVWNVDYIRMAAGRNMSDTALADITTTIDPSFLLNDYTVMPYSQFLANQAGELAAEHSFSVRNTTGNTVGFNYSFTSREAISNSPLSFGGPNAILVPPYSETIFSFPMFSPSFANPGGKVVFEQEYAIDPNATGNVLVNDTIRRQQVFDEYLAYDDGTAEKSYFLNQFATLPATLAVEYHLSQPDTIFGMAIYFGRQVPLAFNKFFSVQVWDDIAVNGGTDQLVYQQELLFPGYADTVNKFWYYKFDIPVPMPAGAFFMGTQQPASSGGDSLYFGLDINRLMANHAYYNVLDIWEPSLVTGAIMMRPILHGNFTPSAVRNVQKDELFSFGVYPNPAQDKLYIRVPMHTKQYRCRIVDIQGRVLLSVTGNAGQAVDISSLQTGAYFIQVSVDGKPLGTQKFIEL
jgi:hypothetical protein